MNKELLEALIKKIKEARRVQAAGFKDEADSKEYLVEREILIDEVAKVLTDIETAFDQELGALKAQLADASKKLTPVVEPMSKDKMFADIGKFVRAAWVRNSKSVEETGGFVNKKERSFDWDERALVMDKNGGIQRAALGDPTGSGTDGQYIINPVYERELFRYATERSDMMSIVRHLPMRDRTLSWPTLNPHKGQLFWHTTYGSAYKQAGKPEFGGRVEMTANTLAGYIPWFDEFAEDIQVNVELGQLFYEMFAELYATEFDYQVLTADSDPYKGVFKMTGAGECLKRFVAGTSPTAVQVEDLRNVPLSIPRRERGEGLWIVSEDFVSHLMSMRNAVGDFLITPPLDATRPGKIVGFPYIEARLAPSMGDVKPGEAFAWFGNPRKHLWHGDRKAVEIRAFRETEQSLLHGEEFLRFRKRDAFKVVQPDLSVLLCTRA